MSTDKLVDSHSDMEEDSREVDSRNSESLDGASSTMKNGRIGLLNVGNTCYMSTGIQCLSHVPELLRLLLSDDYKAMLNKDNVMGSGGLVTESFATLLRELWEGEGRAVNPICFKRAFQSYDSQFEGVEQHDSQEFFAKLVDVLHEDLNLIKTKPYIETPVYTSYDSSQGEEMWNIFLQRNTSKIVDLFYGMTSNIISCTECNECRVRYDPNNVLMLPLPQERFKVIINYLEPRDLSTYDEEAETIRRNAVQMLKSSKEEGTSKEQLLQYKKMPAFRSSRLTYWEYDYNFYGVNRDMYEFAASKLDVSVEDIDLILMEKNEDDESLDVVVHPIDPNSPQSSLSQFQDTMSFIICLKKPQRSMKPFYLRQSFLTYFFQGWRPYLNLCLFGGCFMYYDPEETMESVMKRISSVFFPKLQRQQAKQQEKVKKVISIVLDCVVHPEKRMELREGVLDYDEKEEEEEELPVETEPDAKITQFFKSDEKEQIEKLPNESELLDENGEPKESDSEEYNFDSEEDQDSEEDDLDSDSPDDEAPDEPENPDEHDTKITNYFKSSAVEEGNDKEENSSHHPSSRSCDVESRSDGSSCKHVSVDHDDTVLESYLGKRRRTSSILESSVDDYLQWKDSPCGFPVVIDPYASMSSMDMVNELILNAILRPEHYSIPAKHFLRQDTQIPSLCVVVDAQIAEMPAIYKQRFGMSDVASVDASNTMTDEEKEMFDEIRDVFGWKFHSMHYCKTNSWKKQHNESTEVQLSECFELFKHKGDNDPKCPWFCPKCQKDVVAKSVTYIWSLPTYLVLHLSRFEYVTRDQLQGMDFNFDSRKRKVSAKVMFPVHDLDISEYVHPDAKQEGEDYRYDLIAVCNHMGNADCGHYVAFCRDENDGESKWFTYDDDYVYEMEEKDIVTENAYMLVYQRKNKATCSSQDVIDMLKKMKEEA